MRIPTIVKALWKSNKIKLIKNTPNLIKSIYNHPIAKNYPFNIIIEPTNRCNLDCIMCIRKSVVEKITGKEMDMDFDTFKTILDKIPTALKLAIQGQGEPFLNKEIFDMIKYSKSKGIYTYTISNGTLLTEKMNKKIIESGLDMITFSIDGPTKEIYEKIRIGSNFDLVISNIKNLVKMRNIYSSDLEINVGVVLSKDNFDSLEKYEELFSGINNLTFQKLYHLPLAKDLDVKKEMELIKKKISDLKFKNTNVVSLVVGDRWPCSKPWTDLYVNVNGDVSPCCTIPMMIMGNILENDLEEIWHGEKYQAFREVILLKKPKVCVGEC